MDLGTREATDIVHRHAHVIVEPGTPSCNTQAHTPGNPVTYHGILLY
jgi:hypothetical protein